MDTALVADLIERKFNIRLGVSAVGELLAKLGLTPQKPLQRAYQRDPEAIEAWRRERYPAIARQAKASGGEVYFWDELGFRADSVHGKTWGSRVRRLWLMPWPAAVDQCGLRGKCAGGLGVRPTNE